MQDITRLNEAFQNFTAASRSLETYYERLHGKVRHLTEEVAAKNRQLEQALDAAEAAKDYLNSVLQGLREAIVVLDPERRVSMMNRAAAELLGIDPEQAIGTPFEQLDISITEEGTDTVLKANGRRSYVLTSCSEVRDREGGTRGHVLLLQDITRLKELEEQQERNHRLIAMGEMAAKIVHEVRSPLCSIELYASMLAKDLEGTSHLGMAEGISTGIRSLNNILTNMLFFAKPQKPVFRTVRIDSVLDDCVFMLVPMLNARGISLERGMDNSAAVPGDRELLRQAFLNVLINAVQATPDGGRIGISVDTDGDTAFVDVTDGGEGIVPGDLERIFDPFFSTKEKGTGLGLAITARIVQAHNGVIRVTSDAGRGACFRLKFPRAAAGWSAGDFVKEVAAI